MTMPPQAEIIQLGVGDTVPIGSILAHIFLMGLVTDINNPNMFAATMQAFQRQAVMTVPVLQGVKGDPGEPSFALQWQHDDKTDPSELPTDLGDTVADLGKFWVFGVPDDNGNLIATTMYVWWGTTIGWRQLPVGAPGPMGPYPVITPNIVLEAQGSHSGPGGADSWIHVDGSAGNPVFTFHIAAPQGLPGPVGPLFTQGDVDCITHAPQPGDVLTCSARTVVIDGVTYPVWEPRPPVQKYPMIYTIPEAAFTSALSIGGARHPICTFDVPPQDFPWKPVVFGQVKIFGASISFTPLLVGAEVRLGTADTGQIISRGFGNSLGYTTFIPHTSSSADVSSSMTPTNATGLVPANHTGTQGTLYVDLVNQGMAGVYDFNSADAQLFVAAWPVPQ
jgi:hypothetical protein